MKLGELFQSIVDIGIAADPRGKDGVRRELERLEKSFSDLPESRRGSFDRDRLTNPYADSRLLCGDAEAEVSALMVGVDIEVGEVVLADRLRERGRRIDCLVAHHPEGKALAGFYHVISMQADILHAAGVPINVAEALLDDRLTEVERKSMPVNFTRAVDAARLLDFPFLCAHTPADNCVAGFLEKLFAEKSPETIGDILALLREIPEYRDAARNNAPPRVVAGKESSRAGKIFVDMTGGVEPPKEALTSLAQAGVGVLVGMHASLDHIQKAKELNLNLVVAGHISSDTLGLNLLLDRLRERGAFDVIPCSGFFRVERS
jgi:putative NIF3 family GTP cyclohydrolase 1 type 2